MKILVTGAAGFIGSHLAERLAAGGADVVGLDCFTDYYPPERKRQNAAEISAEGVQLVECDLATDDLAPAVSGAEVVFHLAAQPGISARTPWRLYERNNVVATQRLLEAVQQAGKPRLLVYVSTSSVYGALATGSEAIPPAPTSDYGVTKLAAEQLALARVRSGRLPVTSARLFSVYGPRERPEKLFSRLIESVTTGCDFPLYEGSREHVRSFTYVADAVDGLIRMIEAAEDCVGQIFNLGNDATVSTGEAIDLVEQVAGARVTIVPKPQRSGDQLHTHAQIDLARQILDYHPGTTLEAGVRAQIDWFRHQLQAGSAASRHAAD